MGSRPDRKRWTRSLHVSGNKTRVVFCCCNGLRIDSTINVSAYNNNSINNNTNYNNNNIDNDKDNDNDINNNYNYNNKNSERLVSR